MNCGEYIVLCDGDVHCPGGQEVCDGDIHCPGGREVCDGVIHCPGGREEMNCCEYIYI